MGGRFSLASIFRAMSGSFLIWCGLAFGKKGKKMEFVSMFGAQLSNSTLNRSTRPDGSFHIPPIATPDTGPPRSPSSLANPPAHLSFFHSCNYFDPTLLARHMYSALALSSQASKSPEI